MRRTSTSTDNGSHIENDVRKYEDGKIMWERSISNRKENGFCTYYNRQGERVAELEFHDGVLTQTHSITEREAVIVGRVTRRFTALMGPPPPAGFRYPTPSDDPWPDLSLRLLRISDPRSVPEMVGGFKTDRFGSFLLCLPPGEWGFVLDGTDPATLRPGQFCPAATSTDSKTTSWDLTRPIIADRGEVLILTLGYREQIIGE